MFLVYVNSCYDGKFRGDLVFFAVMIQLLFSSEKLGTSTIISQVYNVDLQQTECCLVQIKPTLSTFLSSRIWNLLNDLFMSPLIGYTRTHRLDMWYTLGFCHRSKEFNMLVAYFLDYLMTRKVQILSVKINQIRSLELFFFCVQSHS